jgi:pyruvate kinase
LISEESALGEYPVLAVAMMSKVAGMVEKNYPYRQALYGDIFNAENSADNGHKGIVDAVTFAAVSTAAAVGAVAIIALTESGFTARMISRFRPEQPIIVMSSRRQVIEELTLSFGCYPIRVEKLLAVDQVMKEVRSFVLLHKFAKKGDKVVIAAGIPFGHMGGTNMLLVEVI